MSARNLFTSGSAARGSLFDDSDSDDGVFVSRKTSAAQHKSGGTVGHGVSPHKPVASEDNLDDEIDALLAAEKSPVSKGKSKSKKAPAAAPAGSSKRNMLFDSDEDNDPLGASTVKSAPAAEPVEQEPVKEVDTSAANIEAPNPEDADQGGQKKKKRKRKKKKRSAAAETVEPDQEGAVNGTDEPKKAPKAKSPAPVEEAEEAPAAQEVEDVQPAQEVAKEESVPDPEPVERDATPVPEQEEAPPTDDAGADDAEEPEPVAAVDANADKPPEVVADPEGSEAADASPLQPPRTPSKDDNPPSPAADVPSPSRIAGLQKTLSQQRKSSTGSNHNDAVANQLPIFPGVSMSDYVRRKKQRQLAEASNANSASSSRTSSPVQTASEPPREDVVAMLPSLDDVVDPHAAALPILDLGTEEVDGAAIDDRADSVTPLNDESMTDGTLNDSTASGSRGRKKSLKRMKTVKEPEQDPKCIIVDGDVSTTHVENAVPYNPKSVQLVVGEPGKSATVVGKAQFKLRQYIDPSGKAFISGSVRVKLQPSSILEGDAVIRSASIYLHGREHLNFSDWETDSDVFTGRAVSKESGHAAAVKPPCLMQQVFSPEDNAVIEADGGQRRFVVDRFELSGSRFSRLLIPSSFTGSLPVEGRPADVRIVYYPTLQLEVSPARFVDNRWKLKKKKLLLTASDSINMCQVSDHTFPSGTGLSATNGCSLAGGMCAPPGEMRLQIQLGKNVLATGDAGPPGGNLLDMRVEVVNGTREPVSEIHVRCLKTIALRPSGDGVQSFDSTSVVHSEHRGSASPFTRVTSTCRIPLSRDLEPSLHSRLLDIKYGVVVEARFENGELRPVVCKLPFQLVRYDPLIANYPRHSNEDLRALRGASSPRENGAEAEPQSPAQEDENQPLLSAPQGAPERKSGVPWFATWEERFLDDRQPIAKPSSCTIL